MEEKSLYHFILIDDSKLDCFIGEKIIAGTGACASFTAFMDANDALSFIENRAIDQHRVIVLLDIQMPLMTGFEFIEKFEAMLSEEQQANYIVNLLSSSINQEDMVRAQSYKSVHSFLNKPLNKERLLEMIAELSK